MRPPFFLVEANGDVIACRTVRDAEVAFESPDVEARECVAAYDADGLLLQCGFPFQRNAAGSAA